MPVEGNVPVAKIVFTANIQRHVGCPEMEAAGCTVREVLENVFAANPQARGYVLDDQSSLRKHMTIFVDGRMIGDRVKLADSVLETSTIYVFQALSGG
jgi:sulfur-carrier protein